MSPTSTVENCLVHGVAALVLLLVGGGPAAAQAPASATAEPFRITDNSFLVEEAFNQEAGIFQNIFGVQFHEHAEWDFGFTQEWPVGSGKHQLSYTVPLSRLGDNTGVGDLFIHYRYQLRAETAGGPAFSPRLSLILPSGREQDGLGAGVVGWQVNLPLSKQRGDFYFHWNAGLTWLPGVSADRPGASEDVVHLVTPHLAGSAIWRTRPMLHLMLEAQAEFEEGITPVGATERTTALTVAPGLRGGWNLDDQQLILGVAVPVAFADDVRNAGVFLYLSYELPFRR